MENCYGIIYIVINKINSKVYIGQKKIKNSISEFDNYWGSGLLIKYSINYYGLKWFKKEIIGYCYSKEELNEAEKECIKFYNSTNRNFGYNISVGGLGGDLYTGNPNIKNGIHKGKNNPMYNKKHTIKSKIKMSISRLNNPNREESILKMKQTKCENKSSQGNKNPMFNKPVKDVWIKKYGKSEANKMWEERNKKVSVGHKGSKNSMYGRCAYDIWVEKYGKEEADKRKIEMYNKKRKRIGFDINSPALINSFISNFNVKIKTEEE